MCSEHGSDVGGVLPFPAAAAAAALCGSAGPVGRSNGLDTLESKSVLGLSGVCMLYGL